jgi:hypothetical protein
MKDFLIQKYEGYIELIEDAMPFKEGVTEETATMLKARLFAYKEILTDLKML